MKLKKIFAEKSDLNGGQLEKFYVFLKNARLDSFKGGFLN